MKAGKNEGMNTQRNKLMKTFCFKMSSTCPESKSRFFYTAKFVPYKTGTLIS
jgi:hypothetical protein